MSRRSENENDGNSGIRGVTVVGGGVIGASWAALFLAPGLSVTVGDPRPGIDEAVRTYVAQAAPALKALGLDTSSLTARLSFAPDLATAARETDLVQENGPEGLELKHEMWRTAAVGDLPRVRVPGQRGRRHRAGARRRRDLRG
ncbi:3-hydroxyacyl-CoA dehydrogenase NAD-binding domain-containing protein [Streptomyces sp. NPDC059224]|uniref:3-hydroxyacyl-CoA dehydrogenase NAD-binding domain-containing protein n=1 Tax=Streptomyces sp. NPDC059224 TaxID=3346775 RepID=UPI0036BD7C26